MLTRDEIADVLGSVPGLAAYRVAPDVVEAYSAWPFHASMRPLNMVPGFPRANRWFAFVALPGGTLDTAMDVGDPLMETVAQALMDAQIRVELVEPLRVQVGPNSAETVPALRFTLAD